MAKVKYGEMISAMSGSINGTTHSRNRGGAYMRNRSIPINPRTLAQTSVRVLLASLSALWRGLSDSDRNSWRGATDNFPYTDQFGDQRTYSGFQLYMRLNGNLQSIGVATNDFAPSPQETPTPTGLTAVANVEGDILTIATDSAEVPSGMTLVVEATPPVSAGLNFVENKYRRIANIASEGALPASVFTEWAAKFGALVVGEKVFFRTFFINNETGQASQKVQTSTIVIDEE